MKSAVRHAAPPALLAKGLTHATEISPVAGDFRVKDAGKRLGLLFREELLHRLSARAANKTQGGVA